MPWGLRRYLIGYKGDEWFYEKRGPESGVPIPAGIPEKPDGYFPSGKTVCTVCGTARI